MNRAPATVTRDGWHVSTTMGGLPGIQVVLNASRSIGGKTLYGDLNGTVWPSREAGHAAALAQGYTQWHVQEWCPVCRTLHRGPSYRLPLCIRVATFRNPRSEPQFASPSQRGPSVVTATPRRGYVASFAKLPHWIKECAVNDIGRFNKLEIEFRRRMALDVKDEAIFNIWNEMEAIRNRNGGKLGGGK